MAAWDKNVERPDLSTINGGRRITANTPITADVMNMIVNMLIYLHRENYE